MPNRATDVILESIMFLVINIIIIIKSLEIKKIKRLFISDYNLNMII